MAEKKKPAGPAKGSSGNNSKDRMTKGQAPKPVKSSDNIRAGGAATATAAAQNWNAQQQLAAFDKAVKLFHGRKFGEAREEFENTLRGPELDVAQRARLHITMCDSRLQKEQPPTLASAEDYYNYGVALINARKLTDARSHLEKGLQMSPNSDHLHFALALAQALSGEYHAASEHLRRAIELEPRNRLLARQDTDFAPMANQPPFDALLYPEKKGW
jgi:tetratricopeptide (TPR) repeat protein